MTFHNILIEILAIAEYDQDVTVNELVEELKVKLSGMMEGPVHEES